MIIPDLNLLLYAYNAHVPQHQAARCWWEGAVNGEELIGLPYEVAYGFVRIAANRRLGAATVPLAVARGVVEQWFALPQVRLLVSSPKHFAKVMELMEAAMASGSVLADAILAAYAIEHRAQLCTNDADFSRFPGLDWYNPLVQSARRSSKD